jgi:hypothetical protein
VLGARWLAGRGPGTWAVRPAANAAA